MTTDHLLLGLMSPRRLGLFLLVSATLALAGAAPVFAHLTGDFTVFEQCPTANPALTLCVYGQTTSGELVLGNTTIPVTHTITLQGGSTLDQQTSLEEWVDAENGETLSKTALPVPGGLAAVVEPSVLPTKLHEIYNKYGEEGLTAVTATIELVGKPGISFEDLVYQLPFAYELPVRVKLANPFLGSECYIGSKASPIAFELTTGTTSPPGPNSPIGGAIGQVQTKGGGQILFLNGTDLVDNAFSTPAAKGCGGSLFSFFVDPAVNARMGLPSAAGHNTVSLEGTQEYAEAEEIRIQKK